MACCPFSVEIGVEGSLGASPRQLFKLPVWDRACTRCGLRVKVRGQLFAPLPLHREQAQELRLGLQRHLPLRCLARPSPTPPTPAAWGHPAFDNQMRAMRRSRSRWRPLVSRTSQTSTSTSNAPKLLCRPVRSGVLDLWPLVAVASGALGPRMPVTCGP